MKKRMASTLFALLLSACGVLGIAACDDPNVDQPGDEEQETVYVMPKQFRQEADYSPRNGVKRDWNKVSSYFCNYGEYQETMNDYDVGIIGKDMSLEGMQQLEAAGVWKIAYITLGEDYSLNVGDGLGPGGYASYYLYDNDEPIPNGDWAKAWKKMTLN